MEATENLTELENIDCQKNTIDDISSISEDITDSTEDTSITTTEPDETEILRQELSNLKTYIEDQKLRESRALSDLDEFRRLYPDTDINTIDSTVWEKVEKGLPLSAAYALFEREEALKKSLADEVNLRNSVTSAGSAGSSPRSDYFSPEEVKAMSGDEVRQNYANIRRSMDYWRNVKK